MSDKVAEVKNCHLLSDEIVDFAIILIKNSNYYAVLSHG